MKKYFTSFWVFALLVLFSQKSSGQDCLTSPVISCPATFFGCPDSDIRPSVIGFASAITNDANCLTPIVSFKDTVMINDPCQGVQKIKRIWRADYPNNANPWLFAECSQIIYLLDDEAPAILGCPSNITVASADNCAAIVSWTAPTATDDCGIQSLSSSFAPGSSFAIGTTTVTYTAIDKCGKQVQCSFTVTVTDNCCNDVPIINCPANIDLCSGSSTQPANTGTATASYGGNSTCVAPEISFTDVTTGQGCATVITRTWRAVNPSSPSAVATCTQTIRLTDTTAPVISNCPSNISVTTDENCTAVVNWTAPTATDNCSLQSLLSTHNPGNTFAPGVTTVRYTATDNCGNMSVCSFTVTVIDNCCKQVPNIQCPADVNSCPAASIDPSVTGSATASYANPQGCKNPTITFTDVQNGSSCNMVITRTWRATNPDDATLFATCIQTIRMTDSSLPVMSNCPSNITIAADQTCSAKVSWTPPTATDNCGIQSLTGSHNPGDLFPIGVTTVRYTVVDVCGNSSVCSFTITVTGSCCNQTPRITCPPAFISCPTASIDPANTGRPIASYDNAQGCAVPTLTYTDVISGTECNRTILRTWRATNPSDASLFAICEQRITLVDNTNPIIMNCPSNITVNSDGSCKARVNWAPPMAMDGCGIRSLTSSHTPGGLFDAGVTTVTYTATDNCGNSATCTFTVTVIKACCDEKPTIICPADFAGCPSVTSDPSITGRPIVTTSNNCRPELVYSDVVINGNCTGARTIRRTWIAVNQNNLSDTCVQMIVLQDTIAPTLGACPGDVILYGERQAYMWAMPSANDNCSLTLITNIPNGSIFEVGTTEVIITALDNCGNKTSCSFIVTIERKPGNGLIVNCPEELVIDCGDKEQSIPRPTVSSDCPGCEIREIPGFVYMGSYNGHLYYCSKEKHIWPEAKAISEASGGYLAIINDAKENQYLKSIVLADAAYIGLSDAAQEGTFKWVDGSSLGYTNWYPGQPNNFENKQDYVGMLKNGQWNDQNNDEPLEFVMEISCIDIHQIAGPSSVKDIHTKAQVSFEIKDACGNIDTCTYDVVLKNQFSLTCPENIYVQSESNEAAVYWDEPRYNTCCDDCFSGKAINGFIYMGYYRGSHYYCSKNNFTWHEANQMSRENGGHLAIIESDEENTYIARQLGQQIAFIGVSDQSKEGQWMNVNGKLQTYFNWRRDQPNNYQQKQHFVELEPTGYWNDNDASYHREFVMEIPGCYPIIQTSGKASGSVFNIGKHVISYKVTDECGNSSTCSFEVTVNKKNSANPNYCSSLGLSTNKAFIKQIQIENYLFKSGNNGGYKHINTPCVSIERGTDLDILMQPGFNGNVFQSYWKIYIDLNQDGDFEDTNEYLGRGRTYNALRGKLKIPSTATLGKTTLRVVMSLGDYADSCGAYDNGETEDYCIQIVNSKSAHYLKNNLTGQFTELTDIGETELVISPNPASGQTQLFSSTGITSIQLFNAQGQIVFQRSYSENTTAETLQLAQLQAGIYLVQVTDVLGSIQTKKLIVEP